MDVQYTGYTLYTQLHILTSYEYWIGCVICSILLTFFILLYLKESFPRVKRFLDDRNELSPLVYIPLVVLRAGNKQEQMAEQGTDTNISILTKNGITV